MKGELSHFATQTPNRGAENTRRKTLSLSNPRPPPSSVLTRASLAGCLQGWAPGYTPANEKLLHSDNEKL